MDQVVGTGLAEVRPGVTLEVLLDEDNHRRRTNADTELLDRAESTPDQSPTCNHQVTGKSTLPAGHPAE